jgi:hypothetical protein
MASQLSTDAAHRPAPSAPEVFYSEASNEPLGVIAHLKDEFGDYSDPMTYDWTWIETD